MVCQKDGAQTGQSLGINIRLFHWPSLPQIPPSVSYTHLDVYKRQIEACMEDVKHHFDDIQQAIEFGCYIQPDNYFVS